MPSLTDRLQNGQPDPHTATQDQFADVRNRVHQVVIESLGASMLTGDVDEVALNQRLRSIVEAALHAEETPLSRADREMLARQISDEVTGYGPLERFLKDETVSEIMVNNHREIYIE